MTPREIIGLMSASLYAHRSRTDYLFSDAVREAEQLWEETRITEVRVCRFCGARFRARRRALYCSAPCRLKGWRKERAGFRMPRGLRSTGAVKKQESA